MIYATSQDSIIWSKDPDNPLPRPMLKRDMSNFAKLTKWNFKQNWIKNVVIVWRETFDTFPEKHKPLKDRINIILTRNRNFDYEWTIIKNTKQEIIDLINQDNQNREYRVIWWKQIYELFAPETLEIHRTIVHWNFANIKDPVLEPEIDFSNFERVSSKDFPIDEKNRYATTFEIRQRK